MNQLQTFNPFRELDKIFWGTMNSVPEYVKTFLPYNIVKNKDETTSIEVSVAGYSKEDLSVELVNGNLTISGKATTGEEVEYIHKGLTTKSFKTSLPVNPLYDIEEVTLKNGILSVKFKKNEEEVNKYDIKLLT